jgi:hypothetical protein
VGIKVTSSGDGVKIGWGAGQTAIMGKHSVFSGLCPSMARSINGVQGEQAMGEVSEGRLLFLTNDLPKVAKDVPQP